MANLKKTNLGSYLDNLPAAEAARKRKLIRERCDVSKAALSTWEYGKVIPKRPIQLVVAQTLGVDRSSLFPESFEIFQS